MCIGWKYHWAEGGGEGDGVIASIDVGFDVISGWDVTAVGVGVVGFVLLHWSWCAVSNTYLGSTEGFWIVPILGCVNCWLILWALKYEVMGWFNRAFVLTVGCMNCWLMREYFWCWCCLCRMHWWQFCRSRTSWRSGHWFWCCFITVIPELIVQHVPCNTDIYLSRVPHCLDMNAWRYRLSHFHHLQDRIDVQ